VPLTLLVTLNADRTQHGITIAGGHGHVDGLRQFHPSVGLIVGKEKREVNNLPVSMTTVGVAPKQSKKTSKSKSLAPIYLFE
jgi:hypothetical protein